MFINELQLKNYRNYENLNISFTNKVNVIIGENAQGKTNLLESIYVLAFTKSYRSFNDKELIFWQKEFAKISGTIHKKNQNIPLEIIFHQNGKKAKKNRIEQKKLSDYLGIMKDRKSTRLNSSHVAISYAVFCLKKKNNIIQDYKLNRTEIL